jgi:hypothetical protein
MHPLLILCAVLAPSADAGDYTRDVKPILVRNCVPCHGPQKQRHGLRLDTAAAALRGGDSGPALLPGKSGDSLLVKAVVGAEAGRSEQTLVVSTRRPTRRTGCERSGMVP